jgi:hypothetical protein
MGVVMTVAVEMPMAVVAMTNVPPEICAAMVSTRTAMRPMRAEMPGAARVGMATTMRGGMMTPMPAMMRAGGS